MSLTQTLNHEEVVVLDHGTGAKLSRELVEKIASILGDTYLGVMEDCLHHRLLCCHAADFRQR